MITFSVNNYTWPILYTIVRCYFIYVHTMVFNMHYLYAAVDKFYTMSIFTNSSVEEKVEIKGYDLCICDS